MHLLDILLVSVLLPTISASTIPRINNTCGTLELKTPDPLFYGRNSTITFIPATDKKASPRLIDAYHQVLTYSHQHFDNKTLEFTFILLQNKTAEQYRAYRVKYDMCHCGDIRFDLHERPTLGPRTNTEGCHGCLLVQVGENVNRKTTINCSISNGTPRSVNITINNKTLSAHQYSVGKYRVEYTVEAVDNMTIVVCSMTIEDLTLNDTARLYVQGLPSTPSQSTTPAVMSVASSLTVKPTTPSQSPKPEVTNVVSTLTTKQGLTSSAQITQSSTETTRRSQTSSTQSTRRINAVSTTQKLFSMTQHVIPTSSPSVALKTTENFISTTNTGQGKNDASVSNQSAANGRFQNVIIAVACAVSAVIIIIAVVIAVVCVKRKRRSVANVPLQDTPREDQVAQEEGYARIEGAECQYAVVNKPKKLSTLQTKQYPRSENIPMETQSQLEKPRGAGELIYADLDKEALTAKPIDSKPAGTPERPRTPTEYVGIDFARTVALQDANKQDE